MLANILKQMEENHKQASKNYLEREGHQIYWSEAGNKEGLPVLIIHGGPGAGSSEFSLNYFDLNKWRVFSFDQRGCGQSKPTLKLENNQTSNLIEDIEELRKLNKIDKWWLFGGSWGTTLAMLYAQK